MSGLGTVAVTSLFTFLGLFGRNGKDTPAGSFDVRGPFVHRNLAIYLVTGKGADSRRYVTLAEGLRAGTVKLTERGAASGEAGARVNELEIENASDDWLFLQAGDVIEGGKQDRTIAADVAIAPHSPRQPISAFCVEHGRWTMRKGSGLAFRGSAAIVGTTELKRSIQAEKSQPRVWEEVARQEARAAAAASPAGAAPMSLSATGTYSAIVENEKLRSDRKEYVDALLGRLDARDSVGIVVAINGKLTASDIYGSPALFRKLASKLLDSYALEAVLHRADASAKTAAPGVDAARAFLDGVSGAPGRDERVSGAIHRTVRETDGTTLFEYAEVDGTSGTRTILHRNFVRK